MLKWLAGSRPKSPPHDIVTDDPLATIKVERPLEIYAVSRVNPIFDEEDQERRKAPKPDSPGKSASSGYGNSSECSSEEPKSALLRDDALTVLEQNVNFVKSILVAVSPRRLGLTPIPEGKVDYCIPKPVWPRPDQPDPLRLIRSLRSSPGEDRRLRKSLGRDRQLSDDILRARSELNPRKFTGEGAEDSLNSGVFQEVPRDTLQKLNGEVLRERQTDVLRAVRERLEGKVLQESSEESPRKLKNSAHRKSSEEIIRDLNSGVLREISQDVVRRLKNDSFRENPEGAVRKVNGNIVKGSPKTVLRRLKSDNVSESPEPSNDGRKEVHRKVDDDGLRGSQEVLLRKLNSDALRENPAEATRKLHNNVSEDSLRKPNSGSFRERHEDHLRNLKNDVLRESQEILLRKLDNDVLRENPDEILRKLNTEVLIGKPEEAFHNPNSSLRENPEDLRNVNNDALRESPDDLLLNLKNDALTESPETIVRNVDGNPPDVGKLNSDAFRDTPEEALRKLSLTLSSSRHVCRMSRALSGAGSSSGTSSSGFSELPYEDLATVRNALIYGTLGHAKGYEKLPAPRGSKTPTDASHWETYSGTGVAEGDVRLKSKGDLLCYPTFTERWDFTLDGPRTQQLLKKIQSAKQQRFWCRLVTSLMGLLFFLLSVMVVSLLLTRGRRVFGSL